MQKRFDELRYCRHKSFSSKLRCLEKWCTDVRDNLFSLCGYARNEEMCMSYATMHTRINKLFVDLIWLGNRFLDKYKPQINMRTLYMAWMTLIKKHINAEDNPGNQLALALWVLWRIHRWLSEQKRCLACVKSN